MITRRLTILTVLLVLFCLFCAVKAHPQTTAGTVIDLGSLSHVYIAVKVPKYQMPMAVDYTQDSVGRTVWTGGTEWVFLPVSSTCVNGTRNPIGLVTVCPPRPMGGHVGACMVSGGPLPLYRDTPVTTECLVKRRAVRR